MRYRLLACDFDGTLASSGQMASSTLSALDRARKAGRKLVLVTGRELDETIKICTVVSLFDKVVAENGAVIYSPSNSTVKLLAHAPPDIFFRTLARKGISPLSRGRVIISTFQPNEQLALDTIQEMGLELGLVFNKGAVMILPTGVNKANGLAYALSQMSISAHNCVAVGDGENDLALLMTSELGIAVANAVDSLKEAADWVTAGSNGKGVAEVVDRLIESDLSELKPKRHFVALGSLTNGQEVTLEYGSNVLIAGSSGSGKSTIISSLMESLASEQYQFCVFDPEGDYSEVESAVSVGTSQGPPDPELVLRLLEKPAQNVVINMVGVPSIDRPEWFLSCLAHIRANSAKTGRPHWIIVDEAHHLIPATEGRSAVSELLPLLSNLIVATVIPAEIERTMLRQVHAVIIAGESPRETLESFCRSAGLETPTLHSYRTGQLIFWPVGDQETRRIRLRFKPAPLKRHKKKYVEGRLPSGKHFYFKGPHHKQNIPAQNLSVFIQIATGVDTETWLYHLRRKDYSNWVRQAIRDAWLADEIEAIESNPPPDQNQSRQLIKQLIDSRYTLPASIRS